MRACAGVSVRGMKRLLLTCGLAANTFTSTAADPSKFDHATKAVESGDFKAITSILVAQDGKIVYEHYFDEGGAQARRNKRSDTTPIAGMLAGLAIEDGRLAGASARIFD